MLGIAFGLGLGSAAGLALGPYIFALVCKPAKYEFLPYEADKKEEIEVPPLGTPIPENIRALLPLTEPWTVWPDVQRVIMLNRIIHGMWPALTRAIVAEVLKQVQVQIQAQVFDKIAIVEDILMAGVSLRDHKDWVASALKFEDFTFGPVPFRLGGMKPYFTADDEVIMDIPVVWGSQCKLKVEAVLRIGPCRLHVPVTVSNLQFKVESRLTLKPLTEVLPCVGGFTLSLTSVPLLDFSLDLFRGIDLMALPIIKDVVRAALKGVLNGMLVYPNCMSIPIMKNFGIMPPAQGALGVTLIQVEGATKGIYVHCEMSVREGRSVQSSHQKLRSERIGSSKSKSPFKYSAEFENEKFTLVVDDFEEQDFRMHLWMVDRNGSKIKKLADGQLPFGRRVTEQHIDEKGEMTEREAFALDHWVVEENVEHEMRIDLMKARTDLSMAGKALGAAGSVVGATASAVKAVPFATSERPSQSATSSNAPDADTTGQVIGALVCKVKWMPFIEPEIHSQPSMRPSATRPSQPTLSDIAAANTPSQSSTAAAAQPPSAAIGDTINKTATEIGQGFQATTAEIAEAALRATETVIGVASSAATEVKKTVDDAANSLRSKSGGSILAKSTSLRVLMPSMRSINTNLNKEMRGVLTLTLVRCMNLAGSSPNYYVRMLLVDPVTDREQVHRSSTVINEVSPRWGDMFDFVMVSPESIIYINVHSVKTGFATAIGSKVSKINVFAKKKKEEDVDKIVGKLQIPLRDVASNSSIKDMWTLNDAEKGAIELSLKWQTVSK